MSLHAFLIFLACGAGMSLVGAIQLCETANRFSSQKRYALAKWVDFGTITLFLIAAVFTVVFAVTCFSAF